MAVRDVGAGALGRVAGFTTRHARWVIGLWLLAAALMTFVVPRVEDVVARDATPFLPADSPSIKALGEMDQGFGEGSGRSISFIVLTGDRLHDDQQTDAYYDRLSTRLHADRRHIADLQDYAAQPQLRSALTSDGTVKEAFVARRKECKGVTFGRVTKKCVECEDTLVAAIVNYVRAGGELPEPSEEL